MEIVLSIVCVVQAVALWAVSQGNASTYRSFLHAVKSETVHEFAMLEKAAAKPRKVKAFKSAPPRPYGM